MARHVRKDDMVIVNSGSFKGRQGKVLRVLTDEDRVVVQGINVRKKNIKKTERNPQGGQIEVEVPIHISNVQPVDGGKPTRVRFKTLEDGSKIRISARSGEQLGPALKKASS